MITISMPEPLSIFRKATSASYFDCAYRDCGAGASSAVKGEPKVSAPFTPIELMKTNRRTPHCTACSASLAVPSALTRRNSTAGSAEASFSMCTRAAQCTTTETPSSARFQSVLGSSPSPAKGSAPAGKLTSGLREQRRSALPAPAARRATARPTKPFAPVMSKSVDLLTGRCPEGRKSGIPPSGNESLGTGSKSQPRSSHSW